MTSAEKIEQVLADLERSAGTVQWELRHGEMIRSVNARFDDGFFVLTDCPLSWLAKTDEPGDYEQAARTLGLTEPEAAVIANAADDSEYADPAIRRRLLAACRLTEDAS